jgi:hypothetical protein
VPAIRRRFIRWSDDIDPLHFNEAASVAALANAASRAGYLALTEYVADKRHTARGRPFRRGRCDLWIASVQDDRSWAFEVKQHFCFARVRAETIRASLKRALKDAREVDKGEADIRVGCLLVGPRTVVVCTSDFIKQMDAIMRTMPIAFRINGGCSPVWIAFELVE